MTYYDIKNLIPIHGRIRTQQGRKVLITDHSHMVIPVSRLRTWNQLTPAQQAEIKRDDAKHRIEAARWAAAKDPTLRPLVEQWISKIRKAGH